MQVIEPALSFCLKNILLATDFSAGSQVALQYARGIAHLESSEVYAIYVSGPNSYRLLLPEPLAITFNQFEEGSDQAPGLLKALLNGLPDVAPVHHQGAIWEVINDVISRNKIDLVVAATHGRTGFSRLVHGSIAEELFRNISCPALIVGPHANGRASSEFKIMRILLATDFDHNSNALLYAGWLAKEFNANLTIVYATGEHRQPMEAASARLRSTLEQAGLQNRPEFVVKDGATATGILEAAQEVSPDVIVLGARHPEPAKIVSHWPWDIAANIIAEARCPVLTVQER